MNRYTIGTNGLCAKNHAICDGAIVVAVVPGGGYPAGQGWAQRTEDLARWICAAMNEKTTRDAEL